MKFSQVIIGLALFVSVIGVFPSCRTVSIPNPEKTKRVKFKDAVDDVFLNPNLIYLIDSVRIPRFVIRFPEVQSSVVKEDNHKGNSFLYYEIEKALVNNGFKVIDRTFFELKTKKSVVFEKYGDYAFEIIGYRPVKYYTGIYLYNRPNKKKGIRQHGSQHYYLGAELSAKIIDLKTGEVVGTMRTNYTPCTKGCKIRYDLYEILGEDIKGEIEPQNKTMESVSVDVSLVRKLAARIAKHLRYER